MDYDSGVAGKGGRQRHLSGVVWQQARGGGGGVLHFILITCQNSLLPSARLTKTQLELELETETKSATELLTEMELERGWAMINAARQRGSR